MKPSIEAAARVLERMQRAHEERRDWLRSLKTGDVVALTCDGADRLKTTERATVRRNDVSGALYVDGHPRRDLRTGEWERGGKNWLALRIDPVEGSR
jgi:hypothetical protein